MQQISSTKTYDTPPALANMVERQIRTWQVLDQEVLNAFYQVPRAAFVPEMYREMAYMDMEIPLGEGEVMLPPKVQARMIQSLKLPAGAAQNSSAPITCLQIGTGSGFTAALLACLGVRVWTLEISPTLANQARQNLQKQNIHSVEVLTMNGAGGLPANAPFDRILISGAVHMVPQALLSQTKNILAALVVPANNRLDLSTLMRYTRTGEDAWQIDNQFEAAAPLMHDFPKPTPSFSL